MKFLLDVNALVALGFLPHEFHDRTARWVGKLLAKGDCELATCSITESGFVRVLSQNPSYLHSVMQARALLLRLKESVDLRLAFLEDNQDISALPKWVMTAKQVTDGHLLALAKAKSFHLATLDKKIRGAFVIPEKL